MQSNNISSELGRGYIQELYCGKSSACAVAVLSVVLLSACSGSNYRINEYASSYGNRNVSHNLVAHNSGEYAQGCFLGIQAALTQPVFIRDTPECSKVYAVASATNHYGVGSHTANGLRGAYPTYYNTYDEGTVLRGSAPYGHAVNETAYTHRNTPIKESGAYAEIGTIAYDVGNLNATGIQGRVGYNFNSYLATELEGSVGVRGIINHSLGAFVVARIPVSKRVSVRARGGYHTTQFGLLGLTGNVDGAAYGAGVEIATGRKDALRLDYTRYSTVIGISNSLAASYIHKF
ncbi:MAG: hypothetical protein COA43_05985 [Robiginitomaculum sp.]|nr:MAG: hypothetical protein COA43_05985 [Robiginitomaculum sp.]